MATFGCAMTASIHNNSLDISGEDLPDGVTAFPLPYAIAALHGSATAPMLPGYEELYEPSKDLMYGATMEDPQKLDLAVETLLAKCDDTGLKYHEVDVSLDARIDYACVLAEHLIDTKGDEDLVAFDPDGPTPMAAAGAVAGLMGESAVFHSEEYHDFFDEALALHEGWRNFDYETVTDRVASIAQRCGN